MENTILVKVKGGEVAVTPRKMTEGLAITPYVRSDTSISEKYLQITHVASGLKLPFGISFKPREAETVLAWLLELGGWNEAEKDVCRNFTGKRKEIYSALNRLACSAWGKK